MDAVRVEHTHAPALVAEGDQILAQYAHCFGQVRKFGGQGERLPITSQ